MIDTILLMLKGAVANPLTHTAQILANVEAVLKMISTEFIKDDNARNAAIDTLCALLQQEKVVTPATTVAPTPSSAPQA